MASILSKFARAAFSTRASPSAVSSSAMGGFVGGGRRSAASRLPRAGGPMSVEEENAKPKSEATYFNSEATYPKSGVTYLDVDAKAFESDEAMWAFYEYWCKYHSISRDRSEMASRFKAFSDSARRVYKFNTSCTNGKCSMNHMADWTKKEKSQLRGKRRTTK